MFTDKSKAIFTLMLFSAFLLAPAAAQNDIETQESSTGVISQLIQALENFLDRDSGNLITGSFAGGQGSDSDPYEISNCQELQNMSNDLSASYELVSDVDCSSYSGFSSVGDFDNRFTGVLDGRNFTVNNLTINEGSSDYVGLLGYLGSGGEVRDIGVVNADINGSVWAGALVGVNDGSVSSSFSTGSVSGSRHVGGLVGYSFGSVSNSFSTGSVSGSGDYVGGLVGYNNDGSVSNSFSTGSVSGSGDYVGGLVGYNNGGSVSDSYWDVESSGQSSSDGGTGLNTNEMIGSNATVLGAKPKSLYSSEYSSQINSGQIIYSYDRRPGNSTALGVNFTVKEGSSQIGNSLNSVGIQNIEGKEFFSNVSDSSLQKAYVDTDNDGKPDIDLKEDFMGFNVWNGNSTLKAEFGGSAYVNPEAEDSIRLRIDDVANPEILGKYNFTLETNDNGNFQDGKVSVEEAWDFLSTWTTVSSSDSDTTGDGYPILQGLDRQTQLEAQGINAFAGGSGTSSNPYEISNCQHLQNMQNDLDAHYELVSDVDCSSYSGFSSVGDWSNIFSGELDGQGYSVENLTISEESSDYVGLIGYLGSGGEVKDIGVVNVNITGDLYVGGLVGFNAGSVSSSFSTGSVDSTTTGSPSGGLVGYNNGGSVSSSYSTADIIGSVVGGLVGENSGSVSSSFSTGSVSGSVVGGLVGENSGSVSDSYWDTESSGQSSSAGSATGLTTGEMQGSTPFCEGTMSGLDFSSTWFTRSGDYPGLRGFSSSPSNLDCNEAPSAVLSGPSSLGIGESGLFNASESSDPNGDSLSYSWSVDSGSISGSSGSVSWGSPGSYIVNVTVNDGNGGSDSDSLTVDVSDVSDPSVDSVSPTGQVGTSSPLIDADFSDNYNLSNYSLKLDGVEVLEGSDISGTSGSANYSASGLGDGQHQFTWNLTDSAGNDVTSQESFSVDTNPPSSTDNYTDSGWRGSSSVDVKLSASDSVSSVENISYRVNGGSYTTVDSNPVTLTISDNGNNTLEYYATDSVGNEESVNTEYVAIDTDAPNINLASPSNKTYSRENVDLNVSADEDVDTWEYSLDGGTLQVFTPNTSLNGLSDGSHKIDVYANDSGGNKGAESEFFTVNTNDPPVASFVHDSPVNINEDFGLNASGSYDTDGSIVSYKWDTNADGTFDDATGVSPNVSRGDNGSYQVSLRVKDEDGAKDEVSETVKVTDESAPIIGDVSPTSNTGRSPNISADFYDNDQLDTFSLALDRTQVASGNLSGSSDSFSYSVSDLTPGQHSYNFSVNDSSGNNEWREEMFTVDLLESQVNTEAVKGALWIQNSDLRWGNGTHEYWLKDAPVINSDSSGPNGALWIQDTKIHWIDESGDERSYEGSLLQSSISGPQGAVWVQNGYIHYIDQNSDERVTN